LSISFNNIKVKSLKKDNINPLRILENSLLKIKKKYGFVITACK